MATKKKKSVFDKLVDAVTDRDEKEAAAEALAAKAAAEKAAAARAAAEKVAFAKAAAEKAAAAKAASDKAAAERAAAAKIAAEKAAAQRIAAAKAAAEKAAAEQAAKIAAAPKKGVVQVRSLYIRESHTRNSEAVGGLVHGNVVTIYETHQDGNDIWARIGDNQWAAMVYKGETYIKLE